MSDNTEDYDSTRRNSDDSAENFENEAKKTANEFKEGWNQVTNSEENKKVLAGILGIVLGGFGAHKFVLGYTQEGLILLGIFLLSFPLMCIIIGAFTIYIPIIIGIIVL